MRAPQRGRELGGVARDAAVAVARALRRLDVDEDGPDGEVRPGATRH